MVSPCGRGFESLQVHALVLLARGSRKKRSDRIAVVPRSRSNLSFSEVAYHRTAQEWGRMFFVSEGISSRNYFLSLQRYKTKPGSKDPRNIQTKVYETKKLF